MKRGLIFLAWLPWTISLGMPAIVVPGGGALKEPIVYLGWQALVTSVISPSDARENGIRTVLMAAMGLTNLIVICGPWLLARSKGASNRSLGIAALASLGLNASASLWLPVVKDFAAQGYWTWLGAFVVFAVGACWPSAAVSRRSLSAA